MPITDWPQEDQPREKLLRKGEEALTDAELLSIFLKTGAPGKTALDLAKELLMEFGGLRKLFYTPSAGLLKKCGIGHAKYAALKAAMELGRRCFHLQQEHKVKLNNTRIVQDFLAGKLRDKLNEVFACAFLDVQFRLLAFEILFQGTIDEINVYPREIVRRGLAHNAAKIIIAHNHPSGCAIPSFADKKLTHMIKELLARMEMTLIDHVIVGNPEHFSFAEAGLL